MEIGSVAPDAVVTPWEVSGAVDYDKLIKQFGTHLLTPELKAKITRAAGESNMLLDREVYFSHRDLDLVLQDHEDGKGFFLYTGRGPSNKMHVGHLLPFLLTKWLQERFDVNVYLEITDDEKFAFNSTKTLDEVRAQANQDILDIIAIGFDPDKTFIFQDTEYIRNIYPLALRVAKKINFSTVKAVFGFENATNIGMLFYPSIQIVPTMFENKRCLIPAAIDQDPYWRIQRDIAESLGYRRAAEIHSKFIPPLTGMEGKMSSSQPETAVYLSDDQKTVRNKIMKYAFSGGQDTVEKHRKLGGNTDVDVSYQWLYSLFEPDDKKIDAIGQDYRSGKMLTGELKETLVEKLNRFLESHQEGVEKARDAVATFKYSGKLAKHMWETTFE
jgi:tryptophanyl-tRNA synthetase